MTDLEAMMADRLRPVLEAQAKALMASRESLTAAEAAASAADRKVTDLLASRRIRSREVVANVAGKDRALALLDGEIRQAESAAREMQSRYDQALTDLRRVEVAARGAVREIVEQFASDLVHQAVDAVWQRLVG